METIKLTLAAMRKNRGESIEEVHKATQISVSTLYAYECGRRIPRINSVLKLLDHYGYGLENLQMEEFVKRI